MPVSSNRIRPIGSIHLLKNGGPTVRRRPRVASLNVGNIVANKTKNAEVTVYHNGVLVQDHTPIAKPTGHGAPEGPTPGPIQLQGHGNPVVYRNIWVVPKN